MSKTHEQYLKEFKEKFPDNFNKIQKFEEIKGYNIPFIIYVNNNQFNTTIGMLLVGKFVSIKSSIDKHQFFLNELSQKHPNILNKITILSEYKTTKTKILIQNKYGFCKVTPNSLLNGNIPTILTAINPTEYWINQAKEKYGDLYDYSLVDYTLSNNIVKIKCLKHNYSFTIKPVDHLSRNSGCSKCGDESFSKFRQENAIGWKYSNWEKAGNKSKNFDSFKVYILKCWDNNKTEEFYKIGKTYQTLKRRFHTKDSIPYNYEILSIIEGDAKIISELEERLKRENKEFKYLPKLEFGGKYECFSQIKDLKLLTDE